MKNKILVVLVLLVFLFGCANKPEEENKVLYKSLESAEISENCAEKKDDVCGLFDCMVDLCWCKQGPDTILYKGTTELESESGIKEFFEEKRDEITGTSQLKVTKAVKLNSVFWNVFFETEKGKQVLTVAADGTVIETVCGV